MSINGARRAEILDTAARLFASSGLRTSLKEIADACGILPGSLYHHFDSKEALIIELVERYQADLDDLATTLAAVATADEDPPERIVALAPRSPTSPFATGPRSPHALRATLRGERPAACGWPSAHRSRSTVPSRDPPLRRAAGTSETGSTSRRSPIGSARCCSTSASASSRTSVALSPASDPVPDGAAGHRRRSADERALDESTAFDTAQRTIDGWDKPDEAEDERLPMLRASPRSEFGRRGYEATTVRDIARRPG